MSDAAPTSQGAGSAVSAGGLWSRRATYGVALAIAVVLIVFYGWAGFWLGFSVVVLARVGVWAIPLVKLSYADERAAEQRAAEDTAEEAGTTSHRAQP